MPYRDMIRKRALELGRDINSVSTSYLMERLMVRLAAASENTGFEFAVKGGQSLGLLLGDQLRPTSDLDVEIGISARDTQQGHIEAVMSFVRTAFLLPISDGLEFDSDGLRHHRLGSPKEGDLRISGVARLGGLDIPLKIDVDFNHSPDYEPVPFDIQGMFARTANPPPGSRVYLFPVEHTIADKLHAKYEDGELSIRTKDFYDLWALAQVCMKYGALDGDAFRTAQEEIRTGGFEQRPIIDPDETTVERVAKAFLAHVRRTKAPAPDDIASVLDEEFGSSAKQCREYRNFIKSNANRFLLKPPGDLKVVLAEIRPFLIKVGTILRSLDADLANKPPGP